MCFFGGWLLTALAWDVSSGFWPMAPGSWTKQLVKKYQEIDRRQGVKKKQQPYNAVQGDVLDSIICPMYMFYYIKPLSWFIAIDIHPTGISQSFLWTVLAEIRDASVCRLSGLVSRRNEERWGVMAICQGCSDHACIGCPSDHEPWMQSPPLRMK